MPRTIRWMLLACLLGSCSTSPPGEHDLPSRRSVPLRVVEFSGNRYLVQTDLDGAKGVPLMVHGNSRMYLSVTHQVGEILNGGPVQKVEDYGYSSRGKGRIRIERVGIESERFSGGTEVPVFDFAEERDTPVQGMLGLPFLLAAQTAVDFRHDKLLLGVKKQRKPDRTLLASGYRSVPFEIGPSGRSTIEVRFPALGRSVPITPSTVSIALTLHQPLFEGKIPMARSETQDRSPSGTTPDEFHADRVEYEIAGARMWSSAAFEDFAEYGKVAEGALESFGMLGFDWMKEHQAVLDYANRRLYFKP